MPPLCRIESPYYLHCRSAPQIRSKPTHNTLQAYSRPQITATESTQQKIRTPSRASYIKGRTESNANASQSSSPTQTRTSIRQAHIPNPTGSTIGIQHTETQSNRDPAHGDTIESGSSTWRHNRIGKTRWIQHTEIGDEDEKYLGVPSWKVYQDARRRGGWGMRDEMGSEAVGEACASELSPGPLLLSRDASRSRDLRRAGEARRGRQQR
jgi:hypothetical protein